MPVESDIYSTKIRAVMVAEGDTMDVNMCAVCAGTSHADDLGGAVEPTLQKVYIPVLPICTMCKSQGAMKSLVGRYRPNGQAIEKRLDQKSKADAASAAVAARVAMRSECGHDDV